MTYNEIKEICETYEIENWSLNAETGLVDVDGIVHLWNKNLTELPLNFGNVKDYFCCDENNLTTLKGAPKTVGGNFECSCNKLTSLNGLPKHIGGTFNCYNNGNLPVWEYRWLFYGQINGKIKTGNVDLDTFLNEHKNPPKSELPKLFVELKLL